MSVIITDGDHIPALAAARSLGRHKIPVIVGDCKKLAISYFSKYTKEHFKYPNPERCPDEFVNKLLDEVKRRKPELLMPVSSLTTPLVAKNKDKFEPYTKVPLPDWGTYVNAYDKYRSVKIAEENGIPVPKTYIFENYTELKNISKEVRYPLVIKFRNETGSVEYAHTQQELLRKIKKICGRENTKPMIQEFIPGEGYGFFALFNKGEPRVIFAHRRIREYPVTGGPSTLRESIRNERLEGLGLRMLKALNWHGVAMVEFKLDRRDNEFKLMEINPKFWGSMPLAISAGVDFPYLLYKMTIEGDIEPRQDFKTCILCRRLLPNDVLWVLKSENKVKSVKAFMQFRGMNYDVPALDDPLPLFYHIVKSSFIIIREMGR